jgi:Tol biopolymer transport system component/DNA-binding winged helix-turn-helix (wHTH) protein
MTSVNPTDRRWYRFGPYVVDAPKRLLWRNGTLVPLTAKAFEVLLVLIQKRDRVVEKQELIETIWPKTIVEENTLTRHISTLRKALEERPDHHEYILTVPGHGYQFVAEAVELEARPDDLHHSFAPDVPHRAFPSAIVLATVGVLTVVTAALIVVATRRYAPAGRTPQRVLRQLTFDSGLQKDPTWSSDGRRVAFASDRAGNSDIWVQRLDDPSPAQLTWWPDEDNQPDWSPDGRQLVFRSEHDGGGLYVVDASGGTPRRLTTFGYYPQWSPNGQSILFSSSGHLGGTARYHVVDLSGASPRPLRPDLLADYSGPLYAAWRPDGRTFSIWGRHARDGMTFLTAAVEAGMGTKSSIAPEVDRQQQDSGLILSRFAWSPSGRFIYFEGRANELEGRANETQSVWRVAVDPRTLAWTAGPDRMTTSTTQDGDAALSPDGRRLVFSAKSARTRLWMFPFDAAAGRVTGDGQAVTSGGAGEQDADLPDDGTRLVYRTLRGGTQQLWERNIIDGQERLLIRGDQWVRTRPRWSSDGTRISYSRRRRRPVDGATDRATVVLTVDRGEERVVTPPDGPEVIPSDWSADGRWVIGGCPQPTTRRVATCLVDTTEGSGPRVRVLTSDPNRNQFEARFSPDQRWVSFIAVDGSDAGVATVFVMPTAGGPWRAITDGSTYDDKPHWAPDGRTLYFVSHRNGILNVWGRRFDTTVGQPVGSIFKVTSFDRPGRMISGQLSQMQIALTATRLFLPITETQSELWILDNVDR